MTTINPRFNPTLVELLGITGGVGMGKSTAQHLLAERGIPIVDTDQLARLLVTPGQPALEEVVAQFGNEVLAEDGTLRRNALAEVVFKDADARRRLERILHPRIRSNWEAQVQDWRAQAITLGAVVIPLLFETDAASSFDVTVCVACSAAAQGERLKERGWSDQEIEQRLAAQWPIERKIAASDYVVWTDGDLQSHAAQWEWILTSLGVDAKKTGGHC